MRRQTIRRDTRCCDRRSVLKQSQQFGRFAIVGACGTAAHYAVLIAGVETLGVASTLATTAGFVVGAAVNYTLNRLITFRSGARHATAIPKYLLVTAFGAVANAAIVWTLSEGLRWHYFVAQLVATGVVLCWNFVGNRYWTFRDALRNEA